MINFIKSKLRKFRRDDDGSIVAEAVIMFPTLFAAVLATFVFFDAFRNQAINLKANYTIADSISRQTDYITENYITNAWNLHRFLTNSPSLTNLRVSVIKYDEDDDEHTIVWSRVKGGGSDYEDAEISMIGLTKSEIPVMPNNEILIVIQTSVDYEPNFSIGLEGFRFVNTSYTRPRSAPDNVCFSYDGSDWNRVCPGDST